MKSLPGKWGFRSCYRLLTVATPIVSARLGHSSADASSRGVPGLQGTNESSTKRDPGLMPSYRAVAVDKNAGLLSPLDEDLSLEAFLTYPGLAFHMARFPEAERRRLHKMICMQCHPEL